MNGSGITRGCFFYYVMNLTTQVEKGGGLEDYLIIQISLFFFTNFSVYFRRKKWKTDYYR